MLRMWQEFVDDLAMTSMARLWDVGKSEPIKVGQHVEKAHLRGAAARHGGLIRG